MSRLWQDFGATDLRVDPMRTIAVLPTAAIEQHGPHLPVGVDTIIGQGLTDALIAACPDDLDIRVLPIQAVGKSNEHLWAPGTLTLSAETALRAWTEIGLSVARAGVRKMLVVNSHGGNADLVSIVARELRVRAGMFCVRMGWGAGLALPAHLATEEERAEGIHGGENETSLMLHLRPETVDMSKAEPFRWTHAADEIPPVGPVAHGWIASDVHPAGVAGDAHLATAEKGAEIAGLYVAHAIEVLRKIERQPLDRFAPVRPDF